MGLSADVFEVNEDGKVEDRSIVDFLWVKVGTDVDTCDGMSDGRDFGKLEGLGDL